MSTMLGCIIEIGRDAQWIAMSGHGIPALLVGKKDDDVWLFGHKASFAWEIWSRTVVSKYIFRAYFEGCELK